MLAAGCGAPSSTLLPTSPASPATGFDATTYLNRIVDLMQAQSLNRRTIDWTQFRAAVLADVPAVARTVQATHPAIELALTLLDDHHSFYTSATGDIILNPTAPRCTARSYTPVPPTVPADIGYVYAGTCFIGCDQST